MAVLARVRGNNCTILTVCCLLSCCFIQLPGSVASSVSKRFPSSPATRHKNIATNGAAPLRHRSPGVLTSHMELSYLLCICQFRDYIPWDYYCQHGLQIHRKCISPPPTSPPPVTTISPRHLLFAFTSCSDTTINMPLRSDATFFLCLAKR